MASSYNYGGTGSFIHPLSSPPLATNPPWTRDDVITKRKNESALRAARSTFNLNNWDCGTRSTTNAAPKGRRMPFASNFDEQRKPSSSPSAQAERAPYAVVSDTKRSMHTKKLIDIQRQERAAEYKKQAEQAEKEKFFNSTRHEADYVNRNFLNARTEATNNARSHTNYDIVEHC